MVNLEIPQKEMMVKFLLWAVLGIRDILVRIRTFH